MARVAYTGPRLWLDRRRGTWTICDGRRRVRTGFTKGQRTDALAALRVYVRDPNFEPKKPQRPSKIYYAKTPPKDGVYVVGFGPYVKIGISLNVEERIATIQTGAPEKLTIYAILEGWMKEERELHKRFDQYRLSGEWFRLEGELAEWLRSIQ